MNSTPIHAPDSPSISATSLGTLPNKTTKKWSIVAIAVGILIVTGIGGFGILGLLDSYGVISAPSWLAPVITPLDIYDLWSLAMVGIILGGGCISYGFSTFLTEASVTIDEMQENETPNSPRVIPGKIQQETASWQSSQPPSTSAHIAQTALENRVLVNDLHGAIHLGPYYILPLIPKTPQDDLSKKDSLGKTLIEKIFFLTLSEYSCQNGVSWGQCFKALVAKGMRLEADEENILHAMIDLFRKDENDLSEDSKISDIPRRNLMRMISEITPILKPNDLNVSKKHPNSTPLHQLMALRYGQCMGGEEAILGLIWKMNPSTINIQNKNGRSLLHLATYCTQNWWSRNNFTYLVVKALCDKGANVTLQDHDGNTPLHLFYKQSIFNSLIENLLNACYNKQNLQGETPLHLFAKRNPQVINYWDVQGIPFPTFVLADVALEAFLTQDSAGNNPLHIAIQNDYHFFVSRAGYFFLQAPQFWNNIISQKNHKGETPHTLYYAKNNFSIPLQTHDPMEEEALNTLGLSKNATLEQIKDKYKKLSRELHPDKNPQGAEQFKAVSGAYEYLTKTLTKYTKSASV